MGWGYDGGTSTFLPLELHHFGIAVVDDLPGHTYLSPGLRQCAILHRIGGKLVYDEREILRLLRRQRDVGAVEFDAGRKRL
jgi:hypothetical protein